MKDILLAPDGDILVGEDGDIRLTDSIRQAVRIRLLWFLGEWRFAPGNGVPYYDEVLVKNPSLDRVKGIVRDEAMLVEGVIDVKDIEIKLDKAARVASVTFGLETDEGTYREEVNVNA